MSEDPRASRQRHSRFVSKLGHELRTPLGSILMMAELLADNRPGNLTDQQLGYARKIRRAASEMRALLDETSLLAKIEGDRLELFTADLELVDLARRIEERPPATPGTAVTVELADGLPPRLGTDRSRLEEILAILIDNAAGSSGGPVTVRIDRSERPGAAVAVAVAEVSPPGGGAIPEERREAIFEPFSQADPRTRRRGGSGHSLELPIARGLAGLLGGELAVMSAPGGTAFVLHLPLSV